MKILISAYACHPTSGSESGAGWALAEAATHEHEVWLLTHEACRGPIEAALEADPRLAARLRPVFLGNPRYTSRIDTSGPLRHVSYLVWQLMVCRKAARELHQTIGFDLAHHVTFAGDWLPVGVDHLGVPFVWGPVGGTSAAGPRLSALLGARAFVLQTLRVAIVTTARVLIGNGLAQRAALVVAQNPDVAAAFAGQTTRIMIEPNVAIDENDVYAPRDRETEGPPVAIFAGRLLPWKGVRIALAAMRRPEAADWYLHVYGDGKARQYLERTSQRWGLTDRVTFLGLRPREEVRSAMTRASVFLYPSIRDGAPWSVAEALAAGCPVVAFKVGGPASLVGEGDGVLVPAGRNAVGRLAAALNTARGMRPVTDRWTSRRMPEVSKQIYTLATETSPVPQR